MRMGVCVAQRVCVLPRGMGGAQEAGAAASQPADRWVPAMAAGPSAILAGVRPARSGCGTKGRGGTRSGRGSTGLMRKQWACARRGRMIRAHWAVVQPGLVPRHPDGAAAQARDTEGGKRALPLEPVRHVQQIVKQKIGQREHAGLAAVGRGGPPHNLEEDGSGERRLRLVGTSRRARLCERDTPVGALALDHLQGPPSGVRQGHLPPLEPRCGEAIQAGARPQALSVRGGLGPRVAKWTGQVVACGCTPTPHKCHLREFGCCELQSVEREHEQRRPACADSQHGAWRSR
jgi:hypothetical protein